MRPNPPFLSDSSNALIKPGGLLRWKVRLVKDTRLLLPLTEKIKIARLTRLPSDLSLSYITASRRASSVIAKAKAEAWQTTGSSLSPKSNPKTVYSLLRSIAGSSSSSSSSPNFANCSSPRESASVYGRLPEIPLFRFSSKDPA